MKRKLLNIIKYKKKGLAIGSLFVLFLIVLGIFIKGANDYDNTYAGEPPLELMDSSQPNSIDNPYLIPIYNNRSKTIERNSPSVVLDIP